ncbi:MAG TPA: inositol monophosphatase [Lentisphaeria bacterium]|nr:MAG: inositol monophosphatase [Lentisphaerae bacterium GWF2_49_21]HBC87597.1 inositol monophosphatase [Lentisphaeria bacterium]
MINFIKSLSSRSGRLALAEFAKAGARSISFKNEKDLVTDADRKIEDFIISEIHRKFPGHDIFGEETGKTEKGSEYCWVIDPIDGTTSFVHGQPFFSVSIALQKKGRTIAGAVNAPKLGEIFWAEKGKGAFCNGRRVHVSRRDKLISSVLCTGFACLRANLKDNNLPIFNKILPRLRGVRRYGSAAIDLSYVACGRLEGFWELNLKPYDIAAGVLILEEAGGEVCDLRGKKNYPEDGILATNGRITREFLKAIK